MPRLSRWLVRTAFVYLVLALALGAVMTSPWAMVQWPRLSLAAPTQFHLFVVGWITQLIAGVAYWMFPRAGRDVPPDDPRGWWVYGGLNAGLVLRAVAEPWTGSGRALVLLPISAALQLAAGVVLVVTLWPRTRGR